MTTVEFTGKPSGDGECFAFEVDVETYKKILGEDSYQFEMDSEVEMMMEINSHMTTELALELAKNKKLFLYPSHFFKDKYGKQLKIRIEYAE